MNIASHFVSVVIPNWNGLKHLDLCLGSLQQQSYQNFEVWVVDNASSDDSVEFISENYPWVNVKPLDNNYGFAKAVNEGINASKGDYIFLLNNDTKLDPQCLGVLADEITNSASNTAMFATKMLKMTHPELIDDAGDILTWRGGAFKRGHAKPQQTYSQVEEVMMPCAGAAMYNKLTMTEAGLFDEKFFAYLEDIDLGLRIRQMGYNCKFIPDAVVFHVGHASDLPVDNYIYLTTRNRILVFLKNIPVSLLIQKLPSLIYGWLFFAFVHRGHKMFFKGTLAVIKFMPHIFRSRKHIKSIRKINRGQLSALISDEWPEISLSELIKLRFKQ